MKRELVIVSGLPGSGKSRLGANMAEQLQAPYRKTSHISLGDEVRRFDKANGHSDYLATVHDHLAGPERYDPLDDAVVQYIASHAMQRHVESNLVFLDGYPRNIDQYTDLGRLAVNEGLLLRGMLITQASEENMLIRLTKRSARALSAPLTPEEAQYRIDVQRPLLDTLYGKLEDMTDGARIPLRTIDTNGPKHITTQLALQALDDMRQYYDS